MSGQAKGDSGRRRLRRIPLFFFALMVTLGLAGACSEREKPAEALASAMPTVRKVDVEGIKQAVQAHGGRVVLVDIWATWCSPCLQQFPHLAEWLAKAGRDKLAVVAVCIDDPDDLDGKVLPFLRGQKTAGIDLLIYGGDHDTMVNEIDPQWGGEVPALFLYDRTGRLRHSLTGEHEPSEVQTHLDELLKP